MTAEVGTAKTSIGEATALNEFERVYLFPGDQKITIPDPRELVVRPSGTHRIKGKNGKLYIISSGWLAIEIEDPSGDWTL